MKTVFKKSYLIENNGCYPEKKMRKLTAPKPSDDDDISIHEVLEHPSVPLYDKYFVVYKLCEITPEDVFSLTLQVLDAAYQYYKTLGINREIVEIIEDILKNYLVGMLQYKYVMEHKETLELIGNESDGDTRFICLGVYHFIDMIDTIEKEEPYGNTLEEAFNAIKNFIRLIVSRPDLKEQLLNDLKEFTS